MEEATEWLCGFCLVNISGYSSKTASFISYPNLASAMRPAPHSDEMPPLIFSADERRAHDGVLSPDAQRSSDEDFEDYSQLFTQS